MFRNNFRSSVEPLMGKVKCSTMSGSALTQPGNANIRLNISASLIGDEVQAKTFGNHSDGLALERLREAINHVD